MTSVNRWLADMVNSIRRELKEKQLGFVWILIVGLVAGLIARAVVPGNDAMGFAGTVLLGLVGSLVGGVLAVLFTSETFDSYSPAGLIGAIIGAIVALLVYRQMRKA
jgi:uncharacterized membrane protein YeaQ/YmgE (transglycosylase-associated protein family)